MKIVRHISVLLAAALCAGAAPFEPPKDEVRVLYRHATLIDGVDPRPRGDMAVLTQGERILAVLPDRQLTPSQLEKTEQFDLTGKFVLPGFIDSHQHFATPPDRAEAEARLRRDAYSGITATRDMADDLRQIGDLARAARVGEIPSPDIYYAALMAGPSFFDDPRTSAAAQGAAAGKVPWMQAIDDKTDLRLAVAMATGTNASAIKIYANLPGVARRGHHCRGAPPRHPRLGSRNGFPGDAVRSCRRWCE